MTQQNRLALQTLLLILPLTGYNSFAQSKNTQQEVTALIQAVEGSHCQFYRNGKSHSASNAADHLRLKWRKGKKHAPTAEAFISNLASKSSWTGKPYHLECPGAARVQSSTWLRQKLTVIRHNSVSSAEN